MPPLCSPWGGVAVLLPQPLWGGVGWCRGWPGWAARPRWLQMCLWSWSCTTRARHETAVTAAPCPPPPPSVHIRNVRAQRSSRPAREPVRRAIARRREGGLAGPPPVSLGLRMGCPCTCVERQTAFGRLDWAHHARLMTPPCPTGAPAPWPHSQVPSEPRERQWPRASTRSAPRGWRWWRRWWALASLPPSCAPSTASPAPPTPSAATVRWVGSNTNTHATCWWWCRRGRGLGVPQCASSSLSHTPHPPPLPPPPSHPLTPPQTFAMEEMPACAAQPWGRRACQTMSAAPVRGRVHARRGRRRVCGARVVEPAAPPPPPPPPPHPPPPRHPHTPTGGCRFGACSDCAIEGSACFADGDCCNSELGLGEVQSGVRGT